MSIRRFFQIAAFLSAMAVAFAAPIAGFAGSADACTGGGEDGGDC